MLALGIDPGTAICGFGLVEMIGNRLRPVHYGAVFTDKDLLPELRLKKIYDGLTELIEEYRPDIMSVEQLFALAMAICGLHTASTRRWTELAK